MLRGCAIESRKKDEKFCELRADIKPLNMLFFFENARVPLERKCKTVFKRETSFQNTHNKGNKLKEWSSKADKRMTSPIPLQHFAIAASLRENCKPEVQAKAWNRFIKFTNIEIVSLNTAGWKKYRLQQRRNFLIWLAV